MLLNVRSPNGVIDDDRSAFVVTFTAIPAW